jgi:hypothetical protein
MALRVQNYHHKSAILFPILGQFNLFYVSKFAVITSAKFITELKPILSLHGS